MKYALICPNEPVLDGYRIAEIQATEAWPPAAPTYWLACEDDVVADYWYFKDDNIIKRTDISMNNGLQSF